MTQAPIHHVTVVHNVSTDPDNIQCNRVKAFLEARQVEVFVLPVATKDCPVVPVERNAPEMIPDMIIVLGGDGTFLRASLCYAHHGVPIVGINTGTLGFLTRIDVENCERYLGLLIQGCYELEERMMLSIGNPRQLALNDVVIKNTNPSQMTSLRVYINETLVAVYDADGIIIATPTGTTAYTLSAGGPVISPEVEAMSITPICPHSLSAKPIVIPANKTLRIEAGSKNKTAICAVDGQDSFVLNPGDTFSVQRAEENLKMVHFGLEEDNFYLLLQKKLFWAMNPRKKSLHHHV